MSRVAQSEFGGIVHLVPHDFGVVESLGTYTHEFSLKNATEASWRLKDAKAECGCTKILSCSREVPPGDFLRFTVQLAPEGERFGPVSEDSHVIIEPGPMLVSATITALIVPEPCLEPPYLRLELPADISRFEGTSRLAIPATWLDPQVTFVTVPPDVEAVAEEVDAATLRTPGQGAFDLRVQGSLPERTIEWTGVLHVSVTSGERSAALPLSLKVARSAPFSVSPEALFVAAEGAKCVSGNALYVTGPISELSFSSEPAEALTFSVEHAAGRVRIDTIRQSPARLLIESRDGHRKEVAVTSLSVKEGR